MQDDRSPELSDNAMRRILSRAIELDHARATRISTRELRQIAADVGVTEESLTAALAEYADARTHPPAAVSAAPPVSISVISTPALLGALVGASGFLWRIADLAIGPTSLMLMLSCGLVAFSRNERTVTRFTVRNLALWSGYAVTLTLALGGMGIRDLSVIASSVSFDWGLTTLVGIGILALARRLERAPAAAGTGGAGGAGGAGGPGGPDGPAAAENAGGVRARAGRALRRFSEWLMRNEPVRFSTRRRRDVAARVPRGYRAAGS